MPAFKELTIEQRAALRADAIGVMEPVLEVAARRFEQAVEFISREVYGPQLAAKDEEIARLRAALERAGNEGRLNELRVLEGGDEAVFACSCASFVRSILAAEKRGLECGVNGPTPEIAQPPQ
jgi:hypothetical protein